MRIRENKTIKITGTTWIFLNFDLTNNIILVLLKNTIILNKREISSPITLTGSWNDNIIPITTEHKKITENPCSLGRCKPESKNNSIFELLKPCKPCKKLLEVIANE